MKAFHLQTEYLTEPLGLGITAPRLMWNAEEGIRQTAYHIVTDQWDSGVVETASMRAVYPCSLTSREQVRWKISLRDENGEWGPWAEAGFEMGLLEPTDWKARWITGDYRPDRKKRYPVDCFRKEFSASGTVKARLYATARGVYDVTLNGHRLEDFILAPGTTDYRKRIQYQTYDVTDLIRDNNILELRLADGWYRGSTGAYGFTAVYGSQTSVMAQLELQRADGIRETVTTGSDWSWSNDGPLRFADLKDGEVYDASLTPSYGGKAVIAAPPKHVSVCASDNVPVREKERFTPVRLPHHVLDFKQNLAGYPEFKIKGRKGQKIRFVCGEMLDADGNVTLTNVQEHRPVKGWTMMLLIKKLMTGTVPGDTMPTPLQEINFVCSGGEDHYKTSFAVFGFRYIQVFTEEELASEDYTAIAVYSDMEQTGSFSCSDGQVNRLFANTVWSMKSNFLDVPTDCPTRERLGWTGDAQIFFHTGAYIMNTAPFFRKWMRDMKDSCYKNGVIPAVFPFSGGEMVYKNTGVSVGWADAIYLIPYRYWRMFGDEEMLRGCLPMIRSYADYLLSHLGQKDRKAAKENPFNEYTYEKGMHLGEWLEPEQFQEKISSGNRPVHTEEATAYLHLAMKTMAEIEEAIGDKERAKRYRRYADGSKKAYARFAELDTDRQAKLVRPLALGLLEGATKKTAEERLVRSAETNGFHVGTGFLSTVFLLPVLSEAGYSDTAYKTLLNKEKPGWLYEVEAGATTIWETWEGELSRNHYSPGAVCQWLFEYCAGIRVKGENRFEIAPRPGEELNFAEASYHSVYGEVKSRWERKKPNLTLTVTLPANTEAEILLPDGARETAYAGTHVYVLTKE